MGNLTSKVILSFLFFSLLGCAHQHRLVPKTHLPPEQKTQTRQIQELTQNLSNNRQTIVRHAIENIGQPYKWGGQSPGLGFDCSGLVVYTHRKAGLFVPRTSKDQFKKGRPISKPALQPGDLVFFNIPEKKTGLHVGIFIGKGQFIHAPGRGRQVRLANLANFYFTQNFKGGRSYL